MSAAEVYTDNQIILELEQAFDKDSVVKKNNCRLHGGEEAVHVCVLAIMNSDGRIIYIEVSRYKFITRLLAATNTVMVQFTGEG